MNYSFREALINRQKAVNSLVCVGLDPLAEKLPQKYQNDHPRARYFNWMQDVVDKTASCTSMFKPQHAHWEALPGGVATLKHLVKYIHATYPDIPVFMDCKRGDIDRTQQQYRVAHFDIEGADGMNYNGYMGRGTLEKLIDRKHPGRALVGLGRTSNSDAWEVQDRMGADGLTAWEFMVDRIYVWSKELGVLADAGVVMGAAHKNHNAPDGIYSAHLSRARELVGYDLWFLIPGIGTQGGFIEQTVKAAYVGPGSIAINSSSGIIFADAPAGAAEELRDSVNQYR